jgi:hypothetical protein
MLIGRCTTRMASLGTHGFHSHLFNIFIHNVDLIRPRLEINSTIILIPIELIQQINNVGQRIIILDGYFVQSMVIKTHFQLVVFFINKQK